jgi:hypothetical protein
VRQQRVPNEVAADKPGTTSDKYLNHCDSMVHQPL